MFTTGFKLFFGISVTLTGAAVVYGYTSGGTHIGPVSMGWKGGVGDHVGYGVLATLSGVALVTSLVLVAFRDADPEAQAQVLGVDEAPSAPAVAAGWWPVVASFGVGAAVVGLVLHPAVFGLGLAITALAMVEWTIDAWADRSTGDAAANRALRNRIMTPVEIPVAGTLAIGVIVLAASRMMLTVSKSEAVAVAGVISSLILAGAAVYASRPGLRRRLTARLGVAASLLLLVGGILAAVRGERDFQHHEPAGHAEEAETSEAGDYPAEDGQHDGGGQHDSDRSMEQGHGDE